MSFLHRLVKSSVFWLALVVGILAVGRVYYWFSVGPTTLNQDEAALLMNARFLVEAGVDEWGRSWPVTFASFGDVKLPGYIYAVAGLGAVFGFGEWVVRFPSVLAGCLLLLAVYWATREWTQSRMAALVSTLLLVISPWTWHYGTIGFEANMALLLFVSGLVCFLQQKPTYQWDILGTLFFLLAAMTYNTPWILLPVVGLALVVARWGEWVSLVRSGILILSVFVGVGALTLPAASQKGAITIFQDPTLLSLYPAFRQSFSGIWQTVLGNQYVYFFVLAAERWLASWSWDFLVLSGGSNPWHSIPGVGHLHPFIPGMAVVGIIWKLGWTLKKRLQKPEIQRLPLAGMVLLFLSPLPAIVTVDAPHATRSLFFFVMLTVWAGYGLAMLYDGMCQRYTKQAWWLYFRLVVAAFVVWGFAWWWLPAQVRWERMLSPKWNAGLTAALQSETVSEAESVFVWDPNGNRYPYAVLASDMSVEEFLRTVQRSSADTVGLVRVEKVGKFTFVFQESDIAEKSGIYLEPNGNTKWDTIETESQ
ncbi:glycosyltransferase family 39 protein [Candidatus Woesebacteria bacterium]|nr:glycosyltransferase family 39 protein [Candidatus Woesebacteria bacterium]MCD8506898.1 glycosyltransferase family 39 protein [Candidatus Woesebacteria bacterium]MCD8546224.1 glycosyltransferase family 39 protein [Candidatus Woesebacteria bacterium]